MRPENYTASTPACLIRPGVETRAAGQVESDVDGVWQIIRMEFRCASILEYQNRQNDEFNMAAIIKLRNRVRETLIAWSPKVTEPEYEPISLLQGIIRTSDTFIVAHDRFSINYSIDAQAGEHFSGYSGDSNNG